MRRAVWTSPALRDVAEIESYISGRTDDATADAFLEKLRVRCERLADLPGTLGTDRSDLATGLRSTPHKNYVIYFHYTDDAIEIVNILDARRDALSYFNTDD